MKNRRKFFLLSAAAGVAAAQERFIPKQSDRPEPVIGEETGFQPIFNGKNLDGWEGDPVYWRVEEGAIVGEIKPETRVKSNTFLIWKGGEPGDFDLKLEYRITTGGNSGINYRSTVIPDPITPSNRFAMRGYQCDIDSENRYTGQNYEEKGRLFLAVRGQATRVTGTAKPSILSSVGDPAQLASTITAGWNLVHLIIRGNTLIHMINGRVMSIVVDDDPVGRRLAGRIGVQVHVGPPMKVEYRSIRLKTFA
jgi:hypothetical protein